MAQQLTIAFDLMGTLLDLSALDEQFRAEFGDTGMRQEWFPEVLKLALAITAMGSYERFANITEAALKIIEERQPAPTLG